MSSYTALKFAELAAKDNRSTPSFGSAKRIITWNESGANSQVKKRKTNEDALRRRKERFGEVSPPRPKYSLSREFTCINSINTSNLELLKKRSERFGESVSALMKEIEEKDKLMKRQARFSHKIPISSPISKAKRLHVKVFNDSPSNVIELFQTIDQIDSEVKRKRKLQLN